MTNEDDDLRARLAQVDPSLPSVPVDPYTSPRAQELMERVMQTPVQGETHKEKSWRKPAALTAAAALVIVLGVGVVTLAQDDDPAPKPKATTTLALKSAGADASMSCMPFSVDVLKEFPIAFAATATSSSDGTVTLAVDRWYKGGTADIVTLAGTPGSVALDGVDFAEGDRYLVTASDGTVTSCGYSGPSTPELEQAFGEAFAG